MKICVFGAGAIGGFMAARLAKAGAAEVSVVARGPHLAAIQQRGLILREGGIDTVTQPRAAASAAARSSKSSTR